MKVESAQGAVVTSSLPVRVFLEHMMHLIKHHQVKT